MHHQVSGMGWKPAEERASTVMKVQTSKTWAKRMEEKAQRQQLLAIKAESVADGRAKRKVRAGGFFFGGGGLLLRACVCAWV